MGTLAAATRTLARPAGRRSHTARLEVRKHKAKGRHLLVSEHGIVGETVATDLGDEASAAGYNRK